MICYSEVNYCKMSKNSLKSDLKHCLINFDQRVLLTDLMNKYELPYKNVEHLVETHLQEQENGKCDKRYMVHGFEDGNGKEIFTIVHENKLQEWLKKLQNAESSLYAVELLGGSKSAAQDLKPLVYCTIGFRDCQKTPNEEESIEEATKVEVKDVVKPQIVKVVENKQVINKKPTKEVDKKVVEKKKSPENKKADKKPLAEKGQITKKTTSPKKMNDFFKKNTTKPAEKTANTPITKVDTNRSLQLFDDEDDDEVEAVEDVKAVPKLKVDKESSDEDENVIKIKNEFSNSKKSIMSLDNSKRRRILDSDDEEEQPQPKQEKKVKEKEKDEEIEPGTYLDEAGFVLTIKPKKTNAKPMKIEQKSTTQKISPVKKTPKKSPPKKKAATKSKQGNILSFFGKK